MQILISIDDTDDIDSRGTGEIAELLGQGLEEAGLARCGRVTRHQLLVHPDIAYTSHNSSMCFPAEIAEVDLEAVTRWCQTALAAESAEASDPGLCIAVVERLVRPQALVEYGREACVDGIRKHGVDEVRTQDGEELADEGRVLVGEECKLVLLDGRAVLLVQPAPPSAVAPWIVVERRALRSY